MRSKPTIRELILARFKTRFKEGNNGFVNGEAIEEVIHIKTGKKHSTVNRVLRDMSSIEDLQGNKLTPVLEKQEMKLEGSRIASIYYKYIPSKNEVSSFIMMNRLKI